VKVLLGMGILMIFLSGCTLEASLQEISSTPDFVFNSAKTTGLIPGSSQSGTTSGGVTIYNIQSTLGSYVSGVEQVTTDNSYKVYSSVQGALISQ
jgi:undecaprenyl pyrophosphate phosphatase UppP